MLVCKNMHGRITDGYSVTFTHVQETLMYKCVALHRMADSQPRTVHHICIFLFS